MNFTIDDVKSAYGERDWGWYDYQPMLELFGNVVIRCDEEGYQGDTIAVIKNGNRFGYVVFGWGSCSGCDALQACYTIQDVFDLAKSMWESIAWYETSEELCKFVDSHDYAGSHLYSGLVKNFKAELAKAFTKKGAANV